MEENSNLKQNIPVISLIAIMAIFLVNRGVNIVTPAMNTFYEHFSDFSRETVAMISTLPNLTLVIGTLVVGAVVGKRFSFKTMAILGSVIYLIGGVAPYFIDDLYVILGCRLLFGFGLGLIYPLSNALINGLYEGDKRATYLGYGTFMLNLGGIALQTLGGILADIDWQLVFLAHAVSLLALVCAFLLPEPPKKEAAAKTGGIWLTAPVAVIGVVFFVYMLMAYPAMLNISVIFSDRLGSGAAVASTALSLYTALAAVSGFFFGMIFKKLKRWCLFLGFAIATIGMVMVQVGNVYIVLTLGVGFIGLGFGIIMPALLAWCAKIAPEGKVAICTSFALAMMNLAGFVSSFYLTGLAAAFGESVYSPIKIAMVVLALMTVAFIVYNPFKETQASA